MKWLRKAVISQPIAVAGCYGPQSMREAPVVYTADAERPAAAVGDCVQNRHFLETDRPLEVAVDERNGVVHVTFVKRDSMAVNEGV